MVVVFVPVAFVQTRPLMVAVPVTERSETVAPPKKVTAIEVVAPRAVTVASVSVEYIERQLVPLARQTF